MKQSQKVASVKLPLIPLWILVAFSGIPTQGLHARVTDAPIVFRVTDAVKPGELLTVYGEGITPAAIQLAVDGPDAGQPTERATMLDIVQTDPEGHFAIAQLPGNLQAGTYNVWVKNPAGWSNPIKLNAARPQWLSIDRIAAGLKVKVVGKNLDGLEFKASLSTRVKLVSKPKPRAFSDDQGRRIEAELISMEGDQVSIRRDGREFTLPLSRFSTADRKFIQDWAAKRAQGNADGEYNAEILDINPYAVEFTVSAAVPHATYDILVSNDGGTVWSGLESDQTLTVGPKVDDPLGLGVFWAGDFNWSRRINVKDHRAKGDGEADDTQAIQSAIDAAKKAGGGVVYLPDGTYRATNIQLPAGVVLLGQSRENTVLAFANQRGRTFFITAKDDGQTEGRTGLAQLKLGIDMNNPQQQVPDFFIALGDRRGQGKDSPSFTKNRKTEKIFIKDVNIDYPLERRGGGRGRAISMASNQYVLMSGLSVKGFQPAIQTKISRYSSISDCRFKIFSGLVAITGNMYTVIERNRIEFTSPLNNKTPDRGFELSSHSYVADNYIGNCSGVDNWNEQIMFEPRSGLTKMYGTISGATSDTVTVNPRKAKDGTIYGKADEGAAVPQNTWDIEYTYYPQGWHVTITDGRGLGQYRKLVSLDGETYTIDRPWDVIPDKTSRFVISVPALNNVAYNNTMKTGSKPLLFYQNAFDSVFAGNHSEGTQGLCIQNYYYNLGPDRVVFAVSYFNRMVNNTVKGVASVRNTGGIGYHFKLELNQSKHEDAYAYACYGLDIKNNYVRSVLPAPAPSTRETPPVNGIWAGSFLRNGKGDKNAIKGVVIENNIIRDSNRGISLGGTLYPVWNRDPRPDTPPLSYGIVVKDNKFMNVERGIVDNNSEATVLINNVAINDQSPPVTTAVVAGQKTGGAHAGVVTVKLAATDDVSGVRRTEYSLDRGVSWKACELPVSFKEEGSHVIHYRSIDRVENMEPSKSLEFTIGSAAAPNPANNQ